MQRRGESGQKRQRATRPKARKVPTARASVAERDELLGQRTRERDEALQQQVAMTEVLGVISSSPSDLKLVFDTILANATRLCEGNLASLWRYDGECLVGAAQYNASPAFVEHYMGAKLKPGPSGPARLAALERHTVHVADITAEPSFTPMVLQYEQARTVLAVPLLREKDLVGVIAIWRRAVRPFTDEQVEWVKSFAAPAVVAIENTRLFNELRQRTDDLSESLEQQTATSEVLNVISNSVANAQPVFEIIARSAARVCGARFCHVFRFDGELVHFAATCGYEGEALEASRRAYPIPPGRDSAAARAILSGVVEQIADVQADPEYTHRDAARIMNFRSIVAVPMLKGGRAVGAIAVSRPQTGYFPERQIELLRTFASQAVIAIENARLLDELRQRTDNLSEALEQQTATSEVLKVISDSPSELKPVFDAILENATRICEAKFGTMWLRERDAFRVVALHNAPPAYEERRRNRLIHLVDFHPKSAFSRFLTTRQVTHISDIRMDQGYLDGAPTTVEVADAAGARTVLMVPMLKDNELVGSITIYRQEVRLFADTQIELVKNFANQAVIAIENTRLLNELRESLQQQTATADVLKVISTSPGELEPVFQTMLENAVQVCEAKFGTLYRCDGKAFYRAAGYGTPAALNEAQNKVGRFLPEAGTLLDRVSQTRKVAQSPDEQAEATLGLSAKYGGARSIIAVPMLKENELIGVIVIYRQEVRPFTDKQIEVVSNFAAQAVIAIENTRLLNELRESLQQQTATADVLKVISRSTFDLDTVLNTLSESATRLCEADGTIIWRPKDGRYKLAACYGLTAEFETDMRQVALKPSGHSPVGRAVQAKKTIHIPDMLADPEYVAYDPNPKRVGGYRAMLGVPLMREGVPIGAMMVGRLKPKAFTEAQIE